MSVYDKELIINGKAVRSPEQQVYQNMKDIKKLQEVIKPEYTTDTVLTSSSVSVAIADTNAPEGTTEGWLLTQDGLKFKINGGDETNLLLEFYADLKGPQGEQGPQGPSANSDKGFYITSTLPTEDDGSYTISSGSLNNVGTGIDIKVNDIIVYIDSNDQPTSMWQITAISGTTITVQPVGTYAKGKQLYEHLITWTGEEVLTYGCHSITIICDKATQFTANELKNWLSENGHNYNGNNSSYKNLYGGNVSGNVNYGSGNYYNFLGLINYSGDQFIGKVIRNNSSPFVWFTPDSFFSNSDYKIRQL